MDAFLENPMTGDKGVRVTGHVKHLHRGMSGSQSFRQYASIYSGHHYVREEEMNRAGVLRRYLLGFSPVRCRKDLIPIFNEKQLRQHAQRFCVFDQQYSLRSTYGQRLLATRTSGSNGLFDTWQVKLE